ncbi:MAG: DUF4038 domain-containing protein [Abditibacteriota bacterium]|nr:DUF4038 domain-containing protein [Abditibacteriota bacterium]
MTIETQEILELTFRAEAPHSDPFWDVTLDIEASSAAGTRLFPCYWAGGDLWKARIAFQEPGPYSLKTVCSNPADKGLHGLCFEAEAVPYSGIDPLKRHGRLKASADRRRLEFADGTPFFWLGDTWWMGLTGRLGFPGDFLTLLSDRVKKGFTLVQIVAGIYPDMDEFDPRGENEAGNPWTPGNETIDPDYFLYMDRRIDALLAAGLVPCIVACWGYYADILGFDRLSRYWRYLIARYGAANVIWCLAGEATMPWYGYHTDPEEFEQRRQSQKDFWSRMARYVRAADPYGTLTTIHPSAASRECVEDPASIDIEMLQSGHESSFSYNYSLELIDKSLKAEPRMPVVQSEVCYEGICEGNRQEAQRQLFWSNMLSGAAGYTYGANGIWQLNAPEWPYGPSPHGASWGTDFWQDAMNYRGSSELGTGKRILEKYSWHRLRPDSSLATPHRQTVEADLCFGAACEDTRVFYLPRFCPVPTFHRLTQEWEGILVNPSDGAEQPLDPIVPDEKGDWLFCCGGLHVLPVMRDWVVVLKKK